jgi:hypothetical protein
MFVYPGRRQEPNKWTPLRAKLQDVSQGHQVAVALSLISGINPQLPDRTTHPIPFPWPRLKRPILRAMTANPFPLSADHLIHLIQYNVFRAVLVNMHTLCIADMFSCEADATDWLRVSAHYPIPLAIPESLAPTELQRTTPHAPYCDVFPSPGLRDAMIKAEGMYDDCELALDVLGSISDPVYQPEDDGVDRRDGASDDTGGKGVIVWGDPWNISSWEVEEGFARKWGWLLRENCDDLLRSTDRWRLQRGEEPLRWSDWGIKAYN